MSTFLPTNSARPRDHLKSNWPEGDVAAFQITRKDKASYDRMCFYLPHVFCLFRLIHPPPTPANGLWGCGRETVGRKTNKAPFRAALLQLAPHLAGATGGSRAAHKGLGPQHVWSSSSVPPPPFWPLRPIMRGLQSTFSLP